MRLQELPDIDFVNADKEAVVKQLLQMYKAITGRILGQADPIRLFILVIANVIILLFNKINDAAKQNLLAYANGANLDHIGAALGVERMQSAGASTTMRITTSAIRPEGVLIPKGTRFTAGDSVLFATLESHLISNREQSIEVEAICQSMGSVGNGYPVGSIDSLVDPIPYVESVTNITPSEGGTDVESDDEFRERIREAPESFSCAGAEGAYIYHAKRASNLIDSVKIVSPKPGDVVVYPVLNTGEIAGQEILNDVLQVLNDKRVRPLTDHVFVKAPTVKAYDIRLTYYLDDNNKYAVSTIKERVDAAVEGYIRWQKSVAGRDINPSELTRRIMEAGAKRVEITSPHFIKIKDGKVEDNYEVELAVNQSKEITYGGIEHE